MKFSLRNYLNYLLTFQKYRAAHPEGSQQQLDSATLADIKLRKALGVPDALSEQHTPQIKTVPGKERK